MSAVDEGLMQRPRYCHCGGVMERAVRIGPDPGRRTNVLICWRCGYEEPSLYGRSANERNRGGIAARSTTYPRGDWMPGRLALGRR